MNDSNALEVVTRDSTSITEKAQNWLDHNEQSLPYVRRVAAHPANLGLMTAFAACSILTGSWALLLFGFAVEACVLAGAPRLKSVRNSIDKELAGHEDLVLAQRRYLLLDGLSFPHKEAYCQLEALVLRIKTKAGSDVVQALNRQLCLDQLLASYLELGSAFMQTHKVLESTSRRGLAREVRALRLKLDADENTPDKIKAQAKQRMALLEKRIAMWDANREHANLLKYQLDTIFDLISLVYEKAMTESDLNDITEDIDQLLGELTDNENILNEVQEPPALQAVSG